MSETAQRCCGEQKISHVAELASGSWSGIWLAPAGPWVGALPVRHAILCHGASQPAQPRCRRSQITKLNDVNSTNRTTVLHLGFLKTSGLRCGLTQSTVTDLEREIHSGSFKGKEKLVVFSVLVFSFFPKPFVLFQHFCPTFI